MLKDFASEPRSTGTTGDLVLTGTAVTGFEKIVDAVGTDKYFPYMIRDGTAWEVGIGYMSSSTNFKRTTRRASSTGSAISCGADAVVSVSPHSGTTYESASPASGSYILSPHVNEQGGGTFAGLDADEIMYIPFDLFYAGTYDEIVVDTTATGTNLRAGIYDVKAGLPHNLLAARDTDFDISSGTGVQIIPLDSSIYLNAGSYFIAIMSDGTPTFSCAATDSIGPTILGMRSTMTPHQIITKSITYSSGMPNPSNATGNYPNNPTPNAFLTVT